MSTSTPMSTPLRTKRNFKSLQLPIAPPTPPKDIDPPGNPVATRTPPIPAPIFNPNPGNPTTTTNSSLASTAAPPPTKKRPPPLGPPPSIAPPPPPPGFLTPGVGSAINSSIGTGRRSAMATLSSTLAKLDMNAPADFHYNLQDADLRKLAELGQGNGGSVVKVEHVPTGTIMAKKIVLIDAKPAIRKQILRELQIMHSCRSAYIVSSYGAFLAEPNICICMEFMDKGSFDGIYRLIGRIEIEVVAMVALAVLEGLTYLYDVHRIIHRDIKPSNILCNSQGEIKLCDFGVSGELINSIAHTFVGTSIYMSPERIQGAEYSVKSDVWSLGISLIELALGRFPFSNADPYDPEDDYSDDEELDVGGGGMPTDPNTAADPAKTAKAPPPPPPPKTNSTTTSTTTTTTTNRSSLLPRTPRRISKRKSKGVSLHGGGLTMSIIELMHHIVKEPAPRLCIRGSTVTGTGMGAGKGAGGGGEGEGAGFRKEAVEFVDACLLKDPEERKSPKELLGFAWMDVARGSGFDLKRWAETF